MTDVFTRKKRSQIMSRVKNKNTVPERIVRSILHRMGFRFRLQGSGLPGNPDIVLPRHKTAIFVHGCFWHGHRGCGRSKRPSTNVTFWRKKLAGNERRDTENVRTLLRLGWRTLVIWGCETGNQSLVRRRLRSFLVGRRGYVEKTKTR